MIERMTPGKVVHAAAIVLAAVAALGAPSVGAQTPARAVVRVTVTDPAGTPLPRAELAIIGLRSTDAVAVAATDSAGRHTFRIALDSARYRITARKVGFVPTIRLLNAAVGDTTVLELRLATVTAVQELPKVTTTQTYRLQADPGDREGFERRCADKAVSCVREDYLADRPNGDLTGVLNHTPGIIPTISTPGHPSPPKMLGLFPGKCVPDFYVNGFKWGLRWTDLVSAYPPTEITGIEVYPAGQPRPGRFSGEPTCGVVAVWTK
jgi:hypothetical protein